MPAGFHPASAKTVSSSITTVGLYIHVPFCRAKCPYCDFFSTTRHDLISSYVAAVIDEIERDHHQGIHADTVYFGGGTPSLLQPEHIARIIDALCRRFAVDSHAEVTLEANPGTVDRQRLAQYRNVGINRLNLGLQSMDDHILTFLGRIHTARQGIDAFSDARAAGLDNVGLDLMFAVPGQTKKGWEDQLARVVDLAPEHLSCYSLTWEAGTPLAGWVKEGRVLPVSESLAATLFSMTGEVLGQKGYPRYEISNFARHTDNENVDYRSRHNSKYWDLLPYLGFGPAAHSCMENRRWWNHRSLDRYLKALKAGDAPTAGGEVLTRGQQIMEFVYLGLRKREGIDRKNYTRRFQDDFSKRFDPVLSRLMGDGLLESDRRCVWLTERGMRFLESVAGQLIECCPL